MVASGYGLNILIQTPYTFCGDWMAFSLTYSIKKFLPEANISIKVKSNDVLFKWIARMKISFNENGPMLLMNSNTIMIRSIEQNCLPDLNKNVSEVKRDKFTPFVTYQEGCGKFVMAEWINRDENPFSQVDGLVSDDMCANELQVLKLWKKMSPLYTLLAKG